MSLDEKLTVAIRAARHHHLSYFLHALKDHRQHESFHIQDWPLSREMGFACKCSGVDREWRVSISAIAQMIPRARESFMRFRNHMQGHGNKARKRKSRKASRRARAVLHRFLTKQQRWDLRASESFQVMGGDGRTYRLTKRECNGIYLLDEGTPRYSFCVVAAEQALPVHDLLLIHKVMLESDPEMFLRTAHVRDLESNRIFESGSFLVDGSDPSINEICDNVQELIPLSEEILDNPHQWVEEQLSQLPLPKGRGSGSRKEDALPPRPLGRGFRA